MDILIVVGVLLAGVAAGVWIGKSLPTSGDQLVQIVKTSPLFVDAAKEVIQFAVGNLDPKMIKGWPHERLRDFANFLTLHAGTAETSEAQILRELAVELTKFAIEAQNEEARRGPKPLPGILPTVPVVPPEPLSGEAKQVWDAAMAGRLMAGDHTPPRTATITMRDGSVSAIPLLPQEEITVPGDQLPTAGELKSDSDLPKLPLMPPPLPPVE